MNASADGTHPGANEADAVVGTVDDAVDRVDDTASLVEIGVSGDAMDRVLGSGPTTLGQALVGYQEGAWPSPDSGDLLGGLPVLGTVDALRVAIVAATDLDELSAALADEPGVAYVEDNNLLAAKAVPDDPRYGLQYGPDLMGFETAWGAAGYGSSDITVAILDSGIRRTHQDLDEARILRGYDYVNDDTWPNDDCGHGTHVAGTLGATSDNGIGVAGASQATILPMKVLSPLVLSLIACSGSASDISAAIVDSADQGARIISMSLGGLPSNTVRNAADYAWERDVLLVAAAGNDGKDNDVDCPACYDSVIAVAAVGADKARASYSDRGPEVEISAPGTGVWSTYNGADDEYEIKSGTSMAAPHVAGALALVLGCDPSLRASDLRALMHETAEDLGPRGVDSGYGHGLLRVDSLARRVGCNGGPGDDPDGGNDISTACGTDPDPSARTLVSGDSESIAFYEGDWAHRKICVDAGQTLQVSIDGPSCSLIDCSIDADLYVQKEARPDEDAYDCRPYLTGSDEDCALAATDRAWYYIAIHAAGGSDVVDLSVVIG